MKLETCKSFLSIVCLSFAFVTCGCNSGSDDNGSNGPTLFEEYERAKAIDHAGDRATELVRIAKEYIKVGDTSTARTCLMAAADAAETVDGGKDPVQRAKVHIALADGWVTAGESRKCEDSYEEAEDVIDSIEFPAEKSEILIALAKVKAAADEKNSAAKDLKSAESELAEIEDVRERFILLDAVIEAYVGMENSDDAKRVITEALAVANGQEKTSEQSRLLAIVGRSQAVAMKDAEGGKATLDEALKIARGIEDNPNLQANVLKDVAIELNAIGQTNQAREILSEAKDLVRNLPEGQPIFQEIERLQQKF